MKKTLYIIAFAAMSFAAAVSCQKESFKAEDEPQISAEGLVFYASLEGAEGTRTTMNYDEFEGYKVEWEAGDSISVNGVIYEATPYKSNPASAVFTKKRSGDADPVAPFEAYYPASIYNSESKTTTLPDTLKFCAEGSLAQVLPMRAYNEDENVLKFKNLCGLLEFSLTGTDKVQYITVIDSTKALSGSFTVDGNGAAVLDEGAVGGVTLYCGDEGVKLDNVTSKKFYVAVPAGDYSKLAVKFETIQKNKFSDMVLPSGATATIVRNGVYSWAKAPRFKGNYFYIEALSAGTQLRMEAETDAPKISLMYSVDDCKTWQDLGSNVVMLQNVGDKVLFKAGDGGNDAFANNSRKNYFYITSAVNVGGNIMFLLDGDDPKDVFTQDNAYAFSGLLKETPVVSASELKLPATTLAEGCYYEMFSGCSSLEQAPELPSMSLAKSCYDGMFKSCTSLTEAPELPATELAEGCYNCMFMSCTNLTAAPEISATKSAAQSFESMFTGCSKLKYVKCLVVDMNSNANNWLHNVSETGTFVKAATASWSRGDKGIPVAWTAKSAYIDDKGNYYGDGITVAGYEWAPVNCGYDEDHTYGLLYQWGRKYGSGYSGVEGIQTEVYDWVGHNGREEKSDEFYAKYSWSKVSTESFKTDWLYERNDKRWGSERTDYDPCPDGWRVPTKDEMSALIAKRSGFTSYENKNGFWFSGSNTYSENVPKIFFPCAGSREYQNAAYSRYFGRTYYGAYWTVTAGDEKSYYLYMHQSNNPQVEINYSGRANANSVRCVNINKPDEQLFSGQEAQSNGYNSTDYNW